MHIGFFKWENLLLKTHLVAEVSYLFDLGTQRIEWKCNCFKIILTDMLLLSPPGFCLMDLTEQFSLPDTAPPMLVRLLEAIERKGELEKENLTTYLCLFQNHISLWLYRATWINFPWLSQSIFSGLENPTLYRTFTAGTGLEVRQYFDSGEYLF